jgi:two-component system, NtrC family, sensor kinase
VRIEVPDDLVLGLDRRKMQQAVLNLVQNALAAIGDTGTVRVSARPCRPGGSGDSGALYIFGEQGCELRGDTVVLTVEDSGPGIPPEIVPRIFDPFFTTRDTGRGSGLGLYIVAEIVRQHQGCIGVASGPGRGTRFLIKLPVDAPAGAGDSRSEA